MSGVQDSFSHLEKHRSQLGENLQKLQKSLQHWQTWDAEYEALKEEVDAITEANEEELARIQNEFEGELVNQREIGEIFGAKGSKSKSQINNILDRRIDYVTKNIDTLNKQVETAENKYAAATVISQPDAQDEEGQPITEIVERLDEDGNVVSYHLNRPGDSIPNIEEALEKAGVTDLAEEAPKSREKAAQQPIPSKPVSQPVQEPSDSPVSVSKGVSFAADTKEDDGPTPQVSRNAKRVELIMQNAKDQENFNREGPVIPEDEDEDDAELRRQMLEYGMSEIGAVVAELEIDEGDSDDQDNEFEYSDEGFDEEGDDEDNYGRYTGRVITPDYQQRMLELEKKLGIRSRFTQEAEPNKDGDEESGSDDERIGRIVVNRNAQPPASDPKPTASPPAPLKSNIKEKQTSDSGAKKGVRFAQDLDVAPEAQPAPAPTTTSITDEKVPFVEPLSDIVERSGPTKRVEAKSTRKPSRFKKTVGDTGIPPGPFDLPAKFLDHGKLPTPTGPDGTTIADALVERDTPVKARGFDEFDDDMINDAVADEYHRMRKKFIHRDGGFLKEDENPIQPLDEADGGQEAMSRFKSARLSKQ